MTKEESWERQSKELPETEWKHFFKVWYRTGWDDMEAESEKRIQELESQAEKERTIADGYKSSLDFAGKRIQELETERDAMREALQPLKLIADMYDENRLDEARPAWGPHAHGTLEEVEIHQGRGGKRTLSLGDCFKARAVLERFKK